MLTLIAAALATVSPISVQERAAVMVPIDAAFAAFEQGNGALLLPHVYPDGQVSAVGTLPSGFSGVRQSSFGEFARNMSPQRPFTERIRDPLISIDGDIALVWAPFTVAIGGKVASCGFDHFDMVRESGHWKIMNITFSSRTTGCPGQ